MIERASYAGVSVRQAPIIPGALVVNGPDIGLARIKAGRASYLSGAK